MRISPTIPPLHLLPAATTTTAMAAPTGGTTVQQPGLALNFLPSIDMKTLSQSELRALSLCSPSSFDTCLTNDIVVPAIDRSSFNESAGSRRQTYARPCHHQHHRHRLPALLPKTPNPPIPPPSSSQNDPSTDPEHLDNRTIILFLKQFLSSHPQFQEPDLTEFDSFGHFNNSMHFTSPLPRPQTEAAVANLRSGEKKRKRGRKPKLKVMSAEEKERAMGLQTVNKNGVVVDLVGLASLEDPYMEELGRRTYGMEKEEELLGFFKDLGGQWCSRRKKRKIVDASEFGDTLPVGWKLLLGLKRKEGRAWVYCRRYISPGGQHFVSCKEVSTYLQSFYGRYDALQAKGHAADNIQLDRGASENHVGASENEEDQRQSHGHDKDITLLGIDNLAEVQIHDLFECHKCNMTFDKKDTYLQHLLSFHQRTTRRYRLGSSVGDGVIVKDGKYECQFCHKVFHERRRYNGHVGIHVRNYMRGIEESPDSRMALQRSGISPTIDEFPTRISKMDALIEIAQNSIRETSSSGPNDESNGMFISDKQNVVSNQQLYASVFDHGLESDSAHSEPEEEDGMIDKSLELELHQQKSGYVNIDERVEKIDVSCDVLDVKIESSADKLQSNNSSETLGGNDGLAFSTDGIEKSGIEKESGSEIHSVATSGNMNLVGAARKDHPKPDELCKRKNVETETGFGSNNNKATNDVVQESAQQCKENMLQGGISEPSVTLLAPVHAIPSANTILDKGKNEICHIEERHDEVTGFEEMKLEDIERLKFSFGTGQGSISVPELPIDLKNAAEMEGVYDVSVQFGSDVVEDRVDRGQLITVCVWCGVEFSHEAVDTEMQSDSVGYMCPACKAKISGQLYVLDSDCV